jgi:DNA-binding MarR family transcriptional regulator
VNEVEIPRCPIRHRARPLVSDVQRLWMAGRERDRAALRPSPGISAVLLAMAEAGPLHGGAIARAAHQDQGNTTVWLAKLLGFGFVERVDRVPGIGNQGGGRPAVIWALTGRGRALVEALRAERAEAVSA